MIIKSKIRMICVQLPKGLELNFIYKLIDRIPFLLEDSSIPVTPDNSNTRDPNEIKRR